MEVVLLPVASVKIAVKAKDALLACPKCTRWPMVATEHRAFLSPRPLFRYVCVGCGYRQDDCPTISPLNTIVLDSKKPPLG